MRRRTKRGRNGGMDRGGRDRESNEMRWERQKEGEKERRAMWNWKEV